ncbi:MAG: FAD-binding oxidoreductase [Bacteroidetes bacterium]|nr:FAD-binding oxidoreductase [Bacteroidota bacterium]
MIKPGEKYDFAIIGGGIFGCYAALYLAKKGHRICIIEKEKELFKKASIVNQARLHSGYHYPRSVATAIMSDDNKARFTKDHEPFINFHFEKYYAIDQYGSLTDAAQFERFCDYIKIKCVRVKNHPLFNFHRLEALYSTTEYTFDPILIAEYYKQKIKENKLIEVLNYVKIIEAENLTSSWKINYQDLDNLEIKSLHATAAFNATYSGSNGINRLFGVSEIKLMHEISEMAFLTCKPLENMGLTVMDGQFGSLMPYGKSGLLSLSSVAYTHHKVSYDNLPHFDCQNENLECQPNFLSNCNFCQAKPPSNYRKMISQISHYFTDKVRLDYFTSLFTIKSKLKANYIDDGRPTEISILNQDPPFYCIFAGKINSIYEVEKII